MEQLHKRFWEEQVASFLHAYDQGLPHREEVLDLLSISRARLFDLLRMYRADPLTFSIAYRRRNRRRLSPEAEAAIEAKLLRDKELIENPEIPISTYSYSALRDRLDRQGIAVSVNTIIDRARKLGCHKPCKKRKVHDREVMSSSIGALFQQDGWIHLWSPYARAGGVKRSTTFPPVALRPLPRTTADQAPPSPTCTRGDSSRGCKPTTRAAYAMISVAVSVQSVRTKSLVQYGSAVDSSPQKSRLRS